MTGSSIKSKLRMIPLREGMFQMPDQLDSPAVLFGSHCQNCGEVFFPRRVYCAACSSKDMEDIELASTGEVETFTIVRQQPPNAAMVPPYAIVRVSVDNGPHVQTVVPGDDLNGVRIGARVQLLIRRLKEDDAGNTVVSFMARPVSS